MNAAHVHLVTNHIPFFSILFGTLATIWYYQTREKAALRIFVSLFLVGAISAVIAVQSGERAETTAKELPGVTHELIHEHEEMGEKAQIAAIILGVLAVITLGASKNRRTYLNRLVFLTAIVGIATTILMARAAWLGGQVRHTEIRPLAPLPPGD
jgi:uncharacterized membrane protein